MRDDEGACTCGRIAVGMTVTDTRNWSPDCAVHGTASAWWNSGEQREARAAGRERLIDLQRRAREARRAGGVKTGTTRPASP